MKPQGITGQSTEQRVQKRLESIGLEFNKPKPDKGVGLMVWDPGANQESAVRVQIKGRGKKQKNGQYRWLLHLIFYNMYGELRSPCHVLLFTLFF
jgi:hypothetical protein